MRARLTSWAVIATGKHLFPFRTEKLSPLAPMVLGEQSPGRVGRRPFLQVSDTTRCQTPFVFSRSRRGARVAARSSTRISSNRPCAPSPVGDWTRKPAAAPAGAVEREVADRATTTSRRRRRGTRTSSRCARRAATRWLPGATKAFASSETSRVTTDTIVASRCGESSSASFPHEPAAAQTTSAAASKVACERRGDARAQLEVAARPAEQKRRLGLRGSAPPGSVKRSLRGPGGECDRGSGELVRARAASPARRAQAHGASRASPDRARGAGARVADRRMRVEQRREPLVGERIRRVDRLGGRAAPRSRRAPSPPRGARARRPARAASRRSRRRAGRRRTPASPRAAGARTPPRSGRARRGTRRWRKPPIARGLDDHGRHDDRDRLDEDVAVAQMRELVRDDPLELGRRGDPEQADRQREPGAPAGASPAESARG